MGRILRALLAAAIVFSFPVDMHPAWACKNPPPPWRLTGIEITEVAVQKVDHHWVLWFELFNTTSTGTDVGIGDPLINAEDKLGNPVDPNTFVTGVEGPSTVWVGPKRRVLFDVHVWTIATLISLHVWLAVSAVHQGQTIVVQSHIWEFDPPDNQPGLGILMPVFPGGDAGSTLQTTFRIENPGTVDFTANVRVEGTNPDPNNANDIFITSVDLPGFTVTNPASSAGGTPQDTDGRTVVEGTIFVPAGGSVDIPVSAVTFEACLAGAANRISVVASVPGGGTAHAATNFSVTAPAGSIPALSPWGMALLGALLLLVGAWFLHRRREVHAS